MQKVALVNSTTHILKKSRTEPGLVTIYNIWPGNGTGLFFQLRIPHGACLYAMSYRNVCFCNKSCYWTLCRYGQHSGAVGEEWLWCECSDAWWHYSTDDSVPNGVCLSVICWSGYSIVYCCAKSIMSDLFMSDLFSCCMTVLLLNWNVVRFYAETIWCCSTFYA